MYRRFNTLGIFLKQLKAVVKSISLTKNARRMKIQLQLYLYMSFREHRQQMLWLSGVDQSSSEKQGPPCSFVALATRSKIRCQIWHHFRPKQGIPGMETIHRTGRGQRLLQLSISLNSQIFSDSENRQFSYMLLVVGSDSRPLPRFHLQNHRSNPLVRYVQQREDGSSKFHNSRRNFIC